jgi:hypothetical protein
MPLGPAGPALPRGAGAHGVLAAPAGPGLAVTIALSVLATGLPIVFHLAGAPVGIAMSVLLGLIITGFVPSVVPAALIFAYLFQNFFVALVSPQLEEEMSAFNSARAYNFLLTAVAWVVLCASYWLQRERFDPRFRLIMTVTTVTLIAIGVYFVLGLLSSPASAVVYLRNIAAPFLLFQVFAIVFYQNRVAMAGPLIVIGLAAVVFGYLELIGHDAFFRAINGDTYLNIRLKESFEAGNWVNEMRESGYVLRSYLDTLRIEFLNSPIFADLGFRLHRLVGPNFHSISFAYALAFFSVVLTAGRHWWFALLAFPLMVVIGSKGSLIFVLLVLAALVVSRGFKGYALLWCFTAALAVYAAVGIVVGIRLQDYHVIGFMGGLRGFLSNPLGHGIGAGGNLSVDMSMINWSQFQHLGEANIALESAIGVLLYQMGFFGIFLLGVLAWLAWKLWALYMRSHDPLLAVGALGLLTILVNGIFQEEALFAPLALGLIAALAGMLLGRAYRARNNQPVAATQGLRAMH